KVELTDLPGHALIDGTSVRVKGSGHCTILHVSYSDEPKEIIEPELVRNSPTTQEKKDAAEAKKKKLDDDIQSLTDELTALNQQSARNRLMRGYADRFAERTVTTTAGGNANAATAVGASDHRPAPSVDDVGKALDWWAARAVQTDAEVHRLELEGRSRLKNAIAELRKALVADPARTPVRQEAGISAKRKPGRVLITIDVQELSPIELQVKYMTKGATWSPSYDLRVDTQTDSVSCTYYGMVTQYTTEDWNGIALRLSTAEPTVHGTPPTLGSKIVALKTCPFPPIPSSLPVLEKMKMKKSTSRRGSSRDEDNEFLIDSGIASMLCASHLDSDVPPAFGYGGVGGGGGYGGAPGAPPPPPAARPSLALVEGGGGGMGAVSFVVEKAADIKSDRQTKKMTIGILQLSAEVTHYIVPAKEPAAYLQAKATNNTDYLLLASDDVSIFFDNSFVTKTSLTSVSPGESFQTFLGIDPAVKITVAPVRKTSKKRGTFSKWNHVTYTHSTSISNKKKVPVTCVVVDAMPRSVNDIIKV
ncbi:unnamed protein product, partial [Hapterophycus canaliculatus]